jgi:hypothetical protein
MYNNQMIPNFPKNEAHATGCVPSVLEYSDWRTWANGVL